MQLPRLALASLLGWLLSAPAIAAKPPPQFQDFPVTNLFKGKPARVDISKNREARRFRTELRRQTAEGPNFAGRFRLARWGCGTSCVQLAFVDCKTGKVYFSPELSYAMFNGWRGSEEPLEYRLDSQLLILRGSRKEEEKVGTFYYLWKANRLRLIRVVPQEPEPKPGAPGY